MRAPSLVLLVLTLGASAEPVSLSGIYPHLAFFNDEGECGTGALVPWADRLWAVTYAPHQPKESSDKLYEITNGTGTWVLAETFKLTAKTPVHHSFPPAFSAYWVRFVAAADCSASAQLLYE